MKHILALKKSDPRKSQDGSGEYPPLLPRTQVTQGGATKSYATVLSAHSADPILGGKSALFVFFLNHFCQEKVELRLHKAALLKVTQLCCRLSQLIQDFKTLGAMTKTEKLTMFLGALMLQFLQRLVDI